MPNRCQVDPWRGEGEADLRVGSRGPVPNKPLTTLERVKIIHGPPHPLLESSKPDQQWSSEPERERPLCGQGCISSWQAKKNCPQSVSREQPSYNHNHDAVGAPQGEGLVKSGFKKFISRFSWVSLQYWNLQYLQRRGLSKIATQSRNFRGSRSIKCENKHPPLSDHSRSALRFRIEKEHKAGSWEISTTTIQRARKENLQRQTLTPSTPTVDMEML